MTAKSGMLCNAGGGRFLDLNVRADLWWKAIRLQYGGPFGYRL